MHASKVIALLVAFAGITMALPAPAPAPEPELEPRWGMKYRQLKLKGINKFHGAGR
ncbi:hypothetical protein TWF106_010035 [Orbilia oligospora]|uniref:Uncharacterized protein n=1 Tax=Orbilia oligospora TaxID=2813651 RepID=A0A6G1LXX6_ORBOL|nr:hypothetical protein TWF679_010495 [Orbilia oligospora]KAF3212105.1 hypothetical protein TWF106_010035 [Orbilia oligospora]KAF3231681.1 hypothetical protein TWF191_005741 [Orbilia oligospora]KAF3236556.1 hypothetical protein TWF192_011390 [Orbilia oligospora]